MPFGEVVAIAGLVLALLGAIYGALAYAFRVGALVTTLNLAIEQLRQKTAALEQMPALVARVEQHTAIFDDISRKVSEFPRMRERLASVSEDVDEIRALKVDSRLAVVEKFASTRGMAAVQAPRPVRREEDT